MSTKSESTPLLPADDCEFLAREEHLVWAFPETWDTRLQAFDDWFIWKIQSYYPASPSDRDCLRNLLYFYSSVATGLFPIEVGCAVAIGLYTIGNEVYANAWMLAVFLTALSSQALKRFVFRPRPGQTLPARAIMGRSETTSSMPSRAVLCTVVFIYLAIASVNYSYHNVDAGIFAWNFRAIPWSALVVFVLVASVSSSFARIFLGMHYISDCIAGFALGVAVIAASAGFYNIPVLDCSSCVNSGCYARADNALGFMSGEWSELNWLPAVFVFSACVMCVLVISIWPIAFWFKSAFIFGSATMALTYRLLFLCPTHDHSGGLKDGNLKGVWPATLFLISFSLFLGMGFGVNKLQQRSKSLLWNAALLSLVLVVEFGWLLLWRL